MADSNPAEDDEKRRQNRIDLIVEQQARIDVKLESVAQRLQRLTERDEAHTDLQGELTSDVAALVEGMEHFRKQVRSALGNLVNVNEVTREMKQQISRRPPDPEKE